MAKTPTDIRSLARSHTEEAINCLVGVIRNGTSEPARVAASNSILDRGWGKAAQPVIGGEEDDAPIKLETIIRKIVEPK